jgi:hypothetical protein
MAFRLVLECGILISGIETSYFEKANIVYNPVCIRVGGGK